MTSLININSPLVFDATMMGALEVYARAGQATIVSPFIVGGAMAPVSVAGTLTQVLAEAMTGIAYAQLVNPGCPVIFGAFVTSIDMNSGAPDLRHPRGLEDPLGRRPARPPPEPALPLRRRPLRLEAPRRAGRLRERQHPAGGAPRRRQLHAPRRRLARGRPRLLLREVRPRRRPARRPPRPRRGHRPTRERPGHGRHPRGRPRRPLPRLRPHPGATSRTPSGAPRSSTTAPTRPGPKPAPPTPPTLAGARVRQLLADYEAPALDPAIAEVPPRLRRPPQGLRTRRLRLTRAPATPAEARRAPAWAGAPSRGRVWRNVGVRLPGPGRRTPCLRTARRR